MPGRSSTVKIGSSPADELLRLADGANVGTVAGEHEFLIGEWKVRLPSRLNLFVRFDRLPLSPQHDTLLASLLPHH